MRLRHTGVTIGIYVILIAILIGVIVAAGFDVLDSQWVAAVSAAIPILITLLASSQSKARQHAPEDTARELARQLAPQVLGDWTAEMPGRGLEPGRRMGLRWQLVEGSNPSADMAVTLAGQGTLDQLTDCIGRDADRGRLPRVVVTGDIGGGKTAVCVLLIVELAERHNRLPVLFQLATWDPGTSLHGWMARQMPEIFPAIGRTKYDLRVAAILVSRYVLPILDGLDEVREPAAALQAIDTELSGRPFILTCRTAEFAQANAGSVLHQALIVELQPLRPDEVRGILLKYEPASVHGPLAPLVAVLEGQPTGPVAESLTTPFMVSLARDAGASVPDLLSAATGPDATDRIKRHLLGTFVRKAYANDEHISPAEARHYLRFLARHTDAAGRLAWWRLHLAVPRVLFLSVAVCVAGAACSGLAALFFALFNRPQLGFWIGLGAGIVGAFIVELVPQDDPRRARPRFRSVRVPMPYELARTLGFGLTGAAALAVIVSFLYTSVRYIVIGSVVSGLTFAVARYVSQPNDPLKVVTPRSLLRADRTAVLYAWLVGAVPGALTGAYLGFSFRAGHRPVYDSLGLLRYPSPVLALLGALGGCVLSGAGLGLMAMGSSSWGRFIWTRLWLAGRGSTPLELISFLQCAYQRGVLRQVNGYYEFRHRVLQRYLAESSPENPDGVPGARSDPAVTA
jgi:NACHT domain